jgi:hypothetical protein
MQKEQRGPAESRVVSLPKRKRTTRRDSFPLRLAVTPARRPQRPPPPSLSCLHLQNCQQRLGVDSATALRGARAYPPSPHAPPIARHPRRARGGERPCRGTAARAHVLAPGMWRGYVVRTGARTVRTLVPSLLPSVVLPKRALPLPHSWHHRTALDPPAPPPMHTRGACVLRPFPSPH